MGWRKHLQLPGVNTRKKTGTSRDRIPFQEIHTPRFGNTGTDWDKISDEVLQDMAAVDKDMSDRAAKAEQEGWIPYEGSKQYAGAQEAWKERQEYLEELGLRSFAERLDIALAEWPRWKAMLKRESGPVAPQSHLTAETAMRSAVAVDRLITLKLAQCGVPKDIAEAFHVECYSTRKTEMRYGITYELRSNFYPIVYVNSAKLQQGFGRISSEQQDHIAEILTQAFEMLAGKDYQVDIKRFIRSVRLGKEEGFKIITHSHSEYQLPEKVLCDKESGIVKLVPHESYSGKIAADAFPQKWTHWLDTVRRFGNIFGGKPLAENPVNFSAIDEEARQRVEMRENIIKSKRDVAAETNLQLAR